MNIVIYHDKHYDWQAHGNQDDCAAQHASAIQISNDETASEEDKAAAAGVLLSVRQMHTGEWQHKAIFDSPEGRDFTLICPPDVQIDSLVEANKRKGGSGSRKQIVARYIAEDILHNHTHPEHITKIVVEDDPEMSSFLEAYFEVSPKQPEKGED